LRFTPLFLQRFFSQQAGAANALHHPTIPAAPCPLIADTPGLGRARTDSSKSCADFLALKISRLRN
jgi:hypothetical protein